MDIPRYSLKFVRPFDRKALLKRRRSSWMLTPVVLTLPYGVRQVITQPRKKCFVFANFTILTFTIQHTDAKTEIAGMKRRNYRSVSAIDIECQSWHAHQYSTFPNSHSWKSRAHSRHASSWTPVLRDAGATFLCTTAVSMLWSREMTSHHPVCSRRPVMFQYSAAVSHSGIPLLARLVSNPTLHLN